MPRRRMQHAGQEAPGPNDKIRGGKPPSRKEKVMEFDSIKVRPLSEDEIKALTVDDLIYVTSSEFTVPVLVPAHITGKGDYYLKQNSLEVKSIYGVQSWRKFGGDQPTVFVADEQGEELPLFRTAGTRVSSTLFFPGMDEEEAQQRLYKALREEFGAGVIQVWNLRTGPVRDIHWDVYAVERTAVYTGKGKDKRKDIVEKSRRVLARGVLDGHTQFFMNQAKLGEEIVSELHLPADATTETI